MVRRSVGENSGSLIGPLGANGFKMVDGDWSMPRLWRYNCVQNKDRMYQNPEHNANVCIHFCKTIELLIIRGLISAEGKSLVIYMKK